MSVTVSDVLQLDILNSAKVIAGKNGLDREVLRINFTDCPINPLVDADLILSGDAFICSFYMNKDMEAKIYDAISFYIQMGSACCIALNEFLPQFPQSVIELADSRDFPIIHIDGTVPYGALIHDISELIISDQSELLLENKIFHLLSKELSDAEQRNIYRHLAPHVQSDYIVVHATFQGLSHRRLQMLKKDVAIQFKVPLFKYLEGAFFVLPCQGQREINNILQQITPIFSYYAPEHSMGYSSVAAGVKQFSSAFRQALSADEIGGVLGKSPMGYDALSVYQLLLPLKNHQILRNFCSSILDPLIKQDLLETVSVYLECNGDVKRAAGKVGKHENTVRFRIGQAKNLLNLDDYEFIEKVSIALKARDIFGQQMGND